jgi:hypothetical protein
MLDQLCCFWAVVKQGIMVGSEGWAKLAVSWRPGSKQERGGEERRGEGRREEPGKRYSP